MSNYNLPDNVSLADIDAAAPYTEVDIDSVEGRINQLLDQLPRRFEYRADAPLSDQVSYIANQVRGLSLELWDIKIELEDE